MVGAGAAGLSCALTLRGHGRKVLVVDRAGQPGGRVQTDEMEGFRLDRGFQVLLTNYPSCRRLLDYDRLRLGRFHPGARLRLPGGKEAVVADPFRRPSMALSSLLAPIGSLGDKLRVARLRQRLLGNLTAPDHAEWRDRSTLDWLRAEGFSEQIIDRFFRPFFSGIFLETDLSTSAWMFAFVYGCFARGHAALPAGGMGALPMQLAEQLDRDELRLSTEVRRIDSNGVEFANGTVEAADHVVVAVDGAQAREWFPELPERPWNGSVCYYFDAPRSPFEGDPTIWLNASGQGRINQIAVPSDVAGGYAPSGRSLISVGTVNDADHPAEPEQVEDELADTLGGQVREWRFLRRYIIPHSLPRLQPADLARHTPGTLELRGIQICGDHLAFGSLEAALDSGRRAAEALQPASSA